MKNLRGVGEAMKVTLRIVELEDEFGSVTVICF